MALSKKLHTKILLPDASRVVGVDSSTTGVAWTLVENGIPTKSGKIDLTKSKEMHDKISIISHKWLEKIEELHPDVLTIEQSIFISNPLTARKLAYVVGTVIGISKLSNPKIVIVEVEPIKWKNWLGYRNITAKMEKAAQINLGPSEGRKLCNLLRKSQTYNVINYNFNNFITGDNDIADSCGIALYGWEEVVAPLRLQIIKDVGLPPSDRAILGI